MPDYSEQIDAVFVSVLEKLAFMFAEVVPKEEIPADVDALLQADISFEGHASGQLSLMVGKDICDELASNILGTDPGDVSDDDSLDAMGELLNTICGQLLTTIIGDKPVFNLSSPEASRAVCGEWQALLNDSATRSFLIDESPVLLKFSMAA